MQSEQSIRHSQKPGIILFNPRSATKHFRLPNSILQAGASVAEKCNIAFVDGNFEKNSWSKIQSFLDTGRFKYFGCTVMPGPQMQQAIPFTKRIKEIYPGVTTIWGGYFASGHHSVVVSSGFVDYVVYGPGDDSFPALIDHLENRDNPLPLNVCSSKNRGNIYHPRDCSITAPDDLPSYPYEIFENFYEIQNYLPKTILGKKTFSYNSGFGCPGHCTFCGVSAIYSSYWNGKSAEKMFEEILNFKNRYGIDAVEFHDNNFFVSKKRVIAFSELATGSGIHWWAEGRPDDLNSFSDDELKILQQAGCKMVFMGAESGQEEILRKVNKGKLKAADVLEIAARFKKAGIIPEFSFVLGFPGRSHKAIRELVSLEIMFIRKIMKVNKDAVIILYIYSPVPSTVTETGKEEAGRGFDFPHNLEDWLTPAWRDFDLRYRPGTPWLTRDIINKIRNFDLVLKSAFMYRHFRNESGWLKFVVRFAGKLRYNLKFYSFPIELKFLNRLSGYQPWEKEGF